MIFGQLKLMYELAELAICATCQVVRITVFWGVMSESKNWTKMTGEILCTGVGYVSEHGWTGIEHKNMCHDDNARI